jgi:hypothetical protein
LTPSPPACPLNPTDGINRRPAAFSARCKSALMPVRDCPVAFSIARIPAPAA